MKLISVEMENWKCFSDSLKIDLALIEIISMPNGSGKTSLFEAIIYGLYGKTANKLETYQNHEGQTRVTIDFEIDGERYEVQREFPGAKATMLKNGKEYKQGSKEIFAYMNTLINYQITKRLWFSGDVSNAAVLDFKFFKEEILAEKLEEPTTLRKSYTSEISNCNKQLREIHLTETRDISEIEKETKELNAKLKKRTSINDTQYSKALQAKQAQEQLAELDEAYNKIGKTPIPEQDILTWERVDIAKQNLVIKQESQKKEDAQLSKLGSAIMREMKKANDNDRSCVICGGTWEQERSDYIGSLLRDGFKDEKKINEARENLKFKYSISAKEIETSKKYHNLQKTVRLSPNYEKIIKEYDDENDKLWERMDSLTRERDAAIRNQEALKRYNELERKVKDYKEKAEFLKTYLDMATEYYTSSILEKSSEILNELNADYNDVQISGEDSSITVLVRGERLYLNQISKGEKTLVALSLIIAVRDIFTPGMPLMFDESFAALDASNNLSIMSYLENSQEQLFVITHNDEWKTHDGFTSKQSVKIRENWEN